MVALNELLALLLKVPVFREFLKPIAVFRRLFLLSKESVAKIRNFNIVAFIKQLPPKAQSQINAAIKKFQVVDILKKVWAELTPDVKSMFFNQFRFNKLLKQMGGTNPSVSRIKKKGSTTIGEKGSERTSVKEKKTKSVLGEEDFLDVAGKYVYDEWVDVISAAVKRSKFTPIDRYKKSGAVIGVTSIEFRTGDKIYDYFDAPLNNYEFWWKAVNQPGPVNGHGYWSFVLDHTQGSRLGTTGRGYLKRTPIVSGYKMLKIRHSGLAKSAARYTRFSYLKTMPRLKMRRSLKPLKNQ